MYKNDLARIYKTEQLELCHGGEPVLMYLHLLSQRGSADKNQVRLLFIAARQPLILPPIRTSGVFTDLLY